MKTIKVEQTKLIKQITKQRMEEANKKAIELKQGIKFSEGNKKLQRTIIWNVPSIITCPWATLACLLYCYAVKAERMYPSVLPRRVRHLTESQQPTFAQSAQQELDKLKKRKIRNKETKFKYVRIHESGDFYNQQYVDKWVQIVKANPELEFLAYTKSYALDFTELKAQPNMNLRYSVDATSKEIRTDLSLAYVRTEETLKKLPQAGDKRETIQCQSDWKCDECRLCWTSNKDVSFELH